MKTMKDCPNLYLKCDILLLDDVFVKFRKRCLEKYGLSWDAMLSMSKIKLDFVLDVGMYLFLKKAWEVIYLMLLKDTVKQTIII